MPHALQVPKAYEAGLRHGYCVIVFFALISFGANAALPLAIAVSAGGIFCIASLIAFGLPNKFRTPVAIACFVFSCLTAWIVLQIIPMPSGISASVWNELPKFGLPPGRHSISSAPSDTLYGWLRALLPFVIFIAGLIVFKSDESARKAFGIIALGGGILATVALAQYFLFPGNLLLKEKQFYLDSFTFFFINRNTAATSLGIIALMLTVRAYEEWTALDRPRILAWIMDGAAVGRSVRFWPFLAHVFLLIVVLVSLALTKSRGGVGSTAVAAAVMLALMSWYGATSSPKGFSRHRRSTLAKVVRAIMSAFGVLIILALFAPQAILRGEVSGVEDGRFCISAGLLSAIQDNLITGGGFGTFIHIFSPYRDAACGMENVWDKAHNFFVEGVIGLGLIFVPLALAILWMLLRSYRIGLRERRSLRLYPIAGISGLILVGLHSIVDFSLQIPGMAAFYAAFAAITVSISLNRTAGTAKAGGPIKNTSGTVFWPASSMIIVGVVLAGSILAAISARDAISGMTVRSFAYMLDRGENVDQAALARLAFDEMPARRLDTCDGGMLRSSLTVLLAHLDATDRDRDYNAWERALNDAEDQVSHNLLCTPADGNLWLRLAMLRQAAGEVPDEQSRLMALSQQLSPSDSRVLVGRLAHWNRLSSASIALSREQAFSDVRTALIYASVRNLRIGLGDRPSNAMRDVLKDVLPLVPQSRQDWLAKNGFDWTDPEPGKGARP